MFFGFVGSGRGGRGDFRRDVASCFSIFGFNRGHDFLGLLWNTTKHTNKKKKKTKNKQNKSLVLLW